MKANAIDFEPGIDAVGKCGLTPDWIHEGSSGKDGPPLNGLYTESMSLFLLATEQEPISGPSSAHMGDFTHYMVGQCEGQFHGGDSVTLETSPKPSTNLT